MKAARRWAHERRIRQTDIAKALEVTPQCVSKWFAGDARPDNETVGRVLDYIEADRETRRASWVEAGVAVGDLA